MKTEQLQLAGLLGGGVLIAMIALGVWDVIEWSFLGPTESSRLRWMHLGRGVTIAVVFMIWGAASARLLTRRQQQRLEQALATRTEALADERAFSTILLENSKDTFLVWNQEGCIQHASRSAERMFGWNPGDLVGRSLKTLLDPRHHAGYDRRLIDARSDSGRVDGVGRVVTACGVRRDGSRFSFEMAPYATTVAGRPVVAAMLRDVTERLRAEQARKRSESLRAVMEELPDAVMVHRNKRLIYVNRRFLDLLGYAQQDEVLGRPIRDFIHPDDWEGVAARLRELASRGKPLDHREERFLGRDGRVVTLEVGKVPVVFDSQQAIAAIGRDVAHRRLAERRFRQAVESAPSGMIMSDSEGSIVLVNGQVECLFGYRESELLGESIAVLIPDRYREYFPAFRDSFLANPVARAAGSGHELYGLHKDGREIPVEIGLNPIHMDEGLFVLSSIVDVRERRKIESLIGMADRMAAVGTLAAGVAHGINNPLAYIKGNVQFAALEFAELLSGNDPSIAPDRAEDVKLALEQAVEGADRIRDMVGDLLTYAQNHNHEASTGADLHSVLDSVVRVTENEMRHRATVEKRYGRIPPVAGDASRLAHAFTNLIVNAAHAIPEGRADANHIRISTSTDEQTGFAVVEIRDSGAGMTDEVLVRVFDPFFTTKPVGAGVGLGMCVTHGIVSDLGGQIEVESEPGVGTRVRVAIPPGQAGVTVDATRDRISGGGARRILVIDDEPRILEMFQRLLRRHTVVVVGRAQQALELIAGGEQFDVVFCDLIMPDTTGAQFHAMLEAQDPTHAERVVFLTGGAFTQDAQAFIERVSNPVLHKPVDQQGLDEAISALTNPIESPVAGRSRPCPEGAMPPLDVNFSLEES